MLLSLLNKPKGTACAKTGNENPPRSVIVPQTQCFIRAEASAILSHKSPLVTNGNGRAQSP